MAASERIFKLLDTPVQVVSPAVVKRPEGQDGSNSITSGLRITECAGGRRKGQRWDRLGASAM